jgi:hypothetical protein
MSFSASEGTRYSEKGSGKWLAALPIAERTMASERTFGSFIPK